MGISEKAIVVNQDILEYIPQRGEILMVDEFFGVEGKKSISGLTIKSDNFFSENGLFSECGVIEHIAQSAALRTGYIEKMGGRDIPLGYIGSVNNFEINALPKVGDRLRTEIVLEQEVMNISLISAKIFINGIESGGCKMKIFLER